VSGSERLSNTSLWHSVKSSFTESVGDIVFGMEDGAVSIAGLVFGVAFSVHTNTPVILAGATGATAAAISMAAGAYLDVESRKDLARQKIQYEWNEVENNRQSELAEERQRFRKFGFTPSETHNLVEALRTKPRTLLKFEEAFEVQVGNEANINPYAHAGWMFLADVIAASTPVLPFFFFPLAIARIVAIIVAARLLFAVGIGRGIIANTNIWITAIATLGIATVAAVGGIVIGQVITGGIHL